MRFNRFLFLFTSLVLFASCENHKSNISEADALPDISACLTSESDDVLEVMTWNLEQFPISGNLTIDLVEHIIENQYPDIIAVQEISSVLEFNELTDRLDGYQSQVFPQGDLNLGFLYKTADIKVIRDVFTMPSDDNYTWPRLPVLFEIDHKSGLTVTLITLHLKCCDGIENYERRLAASTQLKKYIDTNLPERPVIVLGDFNDEIFGVPDSENPFLNFINDSENYLFADMEIAKAGQEVWSYPSWPAHIDHILITDELFDFKRETLTLTLDQCIDEYNSDISDHRPLLIKLGK